MGMAIVGGCAPSPFRGRHSRRSAFGQQSNAWSSQLGRSWPAHDQEIYPMTTRLGSRQLAVAIGVTFLLGACSAASAPAATSGGNPGGASVAPATGAASAGAAGGASAAPAAADGKDITNFDPCSVVSDTDLVKAITDSAGDPTALGTLKATHVAVDGANTGLPGAKACCQTWTTTDSAGRLSQ